MLREYFKYFFSHSRLEGSLTRRLTPIDVASKDYNASKRYAIHLYVESIGIALEAAKRAREKYHLSEHEYKVVFEKLLEKVLGPLKYLIHEFEYLPEDVKNLFRNAEEKELEEKIAKLVSKRIEKIIKEAEKFGET